MELKEYIRVLQKRLLLIMVVCFFFTAAAVFVNKYFFKNIFEADTSLYVGKQATDQNALLYNDLLIGQSLVKDYRELAKSRIISQSVVDALKKEGKAPANLDPQQLSRKISVNLKGETRIIEITIEDQSPANAVIYANKVADIFKVKAKELMKVENIEIIDRAIYPDKPVKPQKTRNIVITFLVGLMAGIGLAFFLEYIDNTLKTSEDVAKYLQIPIIGVIPVLEAEKR
ncbi:MAG: YveK family protein [Deltaproteobacteria bacterium]